MGKRTATLIFVEKKVKLAKCLACNYTWANVKPVPSRSPYCGARLELRNPDKDIIPLTDAYQKKRASTS